MENLQYIVGTAEKGKPAVMRFYGAVSSGTVERFNSEFQWIHDYVQPSKITVYINSEGGSVLSGMATFSLLMSSSIPVATVIDGIAASMGSVIWAAGSELYMRDYSLLMIHNPFIKCEKDETMTEDQKQTVNAFKQQLEIVYTKRFGMTKEKIRAIMSGAENCDGTYMTAKQAAEQGFLKAENIIKTNKITRDKVKSSIDEKTDSSDIQNIMEEIVAEINDFKPIVTATSIPNKVVMTQSNVKNMDANNELLSVVCAKLGIPGDSNIVAVNDKLAEILAANNKVTALSKDVEALTIKKTGLETQVQNLTSQLTQVQSELKAYQDAEKAAKDAEIEAFVSDAVKAGKIKEDVKDKWIAMAQSNFELVKDTLNDIQAVDKISDAIASDGANVKGAQEGKTQAELEVEARIKSVVGEDFGFKKL